MVDGHFMHRDLQSDCGGQILRHACPALYVAIFYFHSEWFTLDSVFSLLQQEK